MSINLELPVEIETRLREEAQSRGMSVEAYIRHLVIMATPPKPREYTIEEKIAALLELGKIVPPGTPPADDSRESIYEGCGE